MNNNIVLNTNKEELITHLKNKVKIFTTKNLRLAADNVKLKSRNINLERKIRKLENENFYIQNISKANELKSSNNQEKIIHLILSELEIYSGFPYEVLKTMKDQRHELVISRQIGHYLAKKFCKLSLAAIGYHIGRKNHATVLYSEKVIKDRLFYDKNIQRFIERTEIKINELITKLSINKKEDVEVIIHRNDNPIRLKVHAHYCKTI